MISVNCNASTKTKWFFMGPTWPITRQDKITEAFDNLTMSTTAGENVPTQITITIKQLADTNNISKEKIKTLTETKACLKAHGGHQQKKSGQVATGNECEPKLYPTRY